MKRRNKTREQDEIREGDGDFKSLIILDATLGEDITVQPIPGNKKRSWF